MRAEPRRWLALATLLAACTVAGTAAIAMLPQAVQSRMDELPADLQQQLRERSRWLEALPAEQRRELRGRVEAWDALPAGERARLR